MADSTLIQLCDQIVTDLSAVTFDGAITIAFTRKLVPRYDLVTHNSGRLGWIMPAGERRPGPDNRAQWEVEYDVQIGVLKKLSSTAEDACDEEQRVIEQIADHYDQNRPLSTVLVTDITCIPFSQEHLDKFQLYLGVVDLTLQSWRD